MKGIRLVFLVLCFVFACQVEKVNPETVELGYEYFPLEKGRSWTYKIHEQIFGLIDNVDTVYYVREEIVDSIQDGDELSYHIHRFSKAILTDSWTLDSVWSAKKTEKYAIRVENNKRFLKLVFPIQKEQLWDENLLNTSVENEAELIILDQTIMVNDTLNYQNALRVEYLSEETFISSKKRFEVYQKNIGLAYSYNKDISTQPNEPKIGKILEQSLIEHD